MKLFNILSERQSVTDLSNVHNSSRVVKHSSYSLSESVRKGQNTSIQMDYQVKFLNI